MPKILDLTQLLWIQTTSSKRLTWSETLSRRCGYNNEKNVEIIFKNLKNSHLGDWWTWKSLSRVWLFVTPWTIQTMEFSRPEYGVGSRSLFQGIFPTQGWHPGLLHCGRIHNQLNHQGSPGRLIRAFYNPRSQVLSFLYEQRAVDGQDSDQSSDI